MTYSQAKLAAHDYTITDWQKLCEASSVLLTNLNATADDIYDGTSLANRASKLRTAELAR